MKYVLVADDELVNQIIFEEMLQNTYEVNIVDDGRQCLDAIAQRIPDLLLLDIAMPGIDGVEVLRQLRSRKETSELPVLIVSAYATEIDKNKGLEAGATDYISKPFDVELVLRQIQSIIGH